MQRFVWSSMARVAIAICVAAIVSSPRAFAQPAEAQENAHPTTAHPDEAGHGQSGPANPLAVDPDLAIWTMIVFLLLLFILSKFAWPHISAALEERERKIAEQIAAAAAKHEEAKRMVAEHAARLAAAAGEVRALLEEAKRDAEQTRRQGEAEGRKAKDEELARALLEIKRAKDAAVHDLATASANTAISLAERVVREKLTADQQANLVREALGRLAAIPPSKN